MMRVLASLVWVLLASPVQAQEQMRDPTAPPASLRQPAAGAARIDAEAPPAPRLQSVLISSRRRVAVIDGETVRLGQKHRGAVVASIGPTQVVLVRGGTKEILKLYPASPGASVAGQR